MDDERILDLYWQRSEQAVAETDARYGGLLRSIAQNILRDAADAEECVSDAYLRAWTTIPPQRPNSLAAYLARIARNLSIDRLRRNGAAKRGGGAMDAALDELGDVVSGRDDDGDGEAIRACIRRFLARQSPQKRWLFVRRYWFLDEIAELARRTGRSEGAVRTVLARMRRKLRDEMQKEGIPL